MLCIFGKILFINVCKVLWLCIELNLLFEQEDWGVGFCMIYDLVYFVLNLNVFVFVIKDDDFVFWELNMIICYFVNCYGGDVLYLVELQVCVWVDQWIDWQGVDLNSLWVGVFFGFVCKLFDYQDLDGIVQLIVGWMKYMYVLNV